MTTESIMTSRVFTLRPADTVAEALHLMHREHVRNLPVVDETGSFIGLFGIRRLSHLLLPKAASDLDRYNIADLGFLPDETGQMAERWRKVAQKPVSDFLESEKKLLFCTPDTAFPKLLTLLEASKDASLPVIIVEGETRKLAGMVSAWDVMEGIVMKLLGEGADAGPPSSQDKRP